jgi:hypothetical protein
MTVHIKSGVCRGKLWAENGSKKLMDEVLKGGKPGKIRV